MIRSFVPQSLSITLQCSSALLTYVHEVLLDRWKSILSNFSHLRASGKTQVEVSFHISLANNHLPLGPAAQDSPGGQLNAGLLQVS